METVIITTTINVPDFLDGICKNMKKFHHNTNKNEIIVIADVKTPKEASSYCKKIMKKYGFKIHFFDIDFQNKFFKKKYKKLYSLFPLNDAIRKLLGSIYLFDNLPSRLIFVDDDNYICNDKDFLKGHLITNKSKNLKVVASKSKWPNLYKFFKERSDVPFYPRGYPWKHRNIEAKNFKIKNGIRKVIANCGYILGDPDIDASSRLFWPIETLKVKEKTHLALERDNFFPLNDQNTSLAKEYIPLYFKPMAGGRNSDIWTSYLIEKISFNFNETASYGPSFLKQIRNKHDYWKDYELEKQHNIATDLFADILNKIKIKNKKNKLDAFIELCESFINTLNQISKKNKVSKNEKTRHYQAISNKELANRNFETIIYIRKYIVEYAIWLKEVKKIFKNKDVY